MLKKSILLGTLCLLSASAAQAVVTVTNSAEVVSDRTQGTAGVATFNATVSGWSLNGGNAVAVFFTAEAGDDFSASYGGQPMNLVEISDGGSPAHYAAIAYLVDPDVTVGDIELSCLFAGGGGANRLSTEYSLLSLGGVGGVAGSNVRTGSGDLIYTTTEDGGYVLAAAEVNRYNGPAPTVSGNPDSFLAQGPYDGNHAVIHAHGDVATAGTYADSYSGAELAATLAFNGGGSPPPPLTLSIAPGETGYDFAWNSLQGKIYDLVSSTDLSAAVETWPIYDPDGEGGAAPFEDIESAGAVTTLNDVPTSGSQRFFSLVERELVVEQVRVFLVGGQSNADGRADPSELPLSPVDLQNPQDDIDFYYKTEGNSPELTTLRPGLSETSGFGPAITFGRTMADNLAGGSITKVAIIKYANGGTNLENQWKAGGDGTITGDGPEYQTFQQTVTSGMAALAAAYPDATIHIEGMIWSQGETDIDGGYANNYETNLTNFIADVRATFVADLPFIVIRLSDGQTRLNATGLATVRAAQVNVADADPNTDWIDTDTFGLKSDNLHFNGDGQQSIGTAAASALLDLLP